MAEGVVAVVADGPRHQEHTREVAPEGDAVVPSAAAAAADNLPLPALLVVTALAAAAFSQGAYYRSGQWMVAGLLAAAAVMAAARHSWPAPPRPLLIVGAALAGWSVVSATAAGHATAALGTVLVLAGGLVVVLTCGRVGGAEREQLAAAVVGLGVAVALTGWVGVAWRRSPWALQDQGLWRAATTLTYANVAAGFLAAVALLALARAAASRSVVPVLASCVLLTALGATLSRGGSIAFFVGAVVLARLLGLPATLRALAPPAAGALVALAGLWPSIPASAPARPVLAAGALAAGLLVAAATSRLDRRALLVLALALPLGIAAVAAGPGREASRHITVPRLTLASSDRVEQARAALEVAADRPLLGSGPGMADLSWTRDDGAVLVARYVHNEYLQVLAELGVVGLALLLALLAVIAWRVRSAGRVPACNRSTWAGCAAGLVALGVHGLFDFGWHVPAIALTSALLVGIATITEKEAQK